MSGRWWTIIFTTMPTVLKRLLTETRTSEFRNKNFPTACFILPMRSSAFRAVRNNVVSGIHGFLLRKRLPSLHFQLFQANPIFFSRYYECINRLLYEQCSVKRANNSILHRRKKTLVIEDFPFQSRIRIWHSSTQCLVYIQLISVSLYPIMPLGIRLFTWRAHWIRGARSARCRPKRKWYIPIISGT